MGKFVRELETGQGADLRQPVGVSCVESLVSERELAAIGRAMEGFVQWCDVPAQSDAMARTPIRNALPIVLARYLARLAASRAKRTETDIRAAAG